MPEETIYQEARRIGHTAGFMIAVPAASLILGWLTGHIEHVLAVSALFLLVGCRLLAFLAIMVHQTRTQNTNL